MIHGEEEKEDDDEEEDEGGRGFADEWRHVVLSVEA